MQNPMVAQKVQHKFKQAVKKKEKPVVLITKETIDYMLQVKPLKGFRGSYFSVMINCDASYRVKERSNHSHIELRCDGYPGSVLSVTVDVRDILSEYDIIFDESFDNLGYLINIIGHMDVRHQITIKCNYVNYVNCDHTNVTVIANRIGVLELCGINYATEIDNIICPNIGRLAPSDPVVKHAIEEQGRQYQRETKAMTVISALFLNHKQRCCVISDKYC